VLHALKNSIEIQLRYPEYWDFVNPMTFWPTPLWQWAVDILYNVPGGDQYQQERDSYLQIALLGWHAF
jgi:hypothetical protein